MKTLVLALLVCLVPALAHAQRPRNINIDADSTGYVLLGGKWATANIPYYVNVDSCVKGALQVYGTVVDPVKLLADLQQAPANWQQQTGAQINPTYMGTTTVTGLVNDGLNTVSCLTGASPNGFIGQSSGSWNLDAQGNMVDADVVFWLGTYPQYPFMTRDQPCGSGLYFVDTGTHEFGHFFGLGHSADTLATMYASTSVCSTNEETLYIDDIQGIQALYPVGGTTEPPPPPPPPPPPSCTSGDFLQFTVRNKDVTTTVSTLQAQGYLVTTTNLKKGNTQITAVCP